MIRKFSEKERNEICALFEKGAFLRDIAKKYGHSYGFIRGIIISELGKRYEEIAKKHSTEACRKVGEMKTEAQIKARRKVGLKNIKKARKAIGRKSSKLELIFGQALVKHKFSFQSQYKIPDTNYIGDFFIEPNLIIEVDGFYHYKIERQKSDKRRDQKIEALDYKVIRFWAHEINKDVDKCIEWLRKSALFNT